MDCDDLVSLAKVRLWMSVFISEVFGINYYWSFKHPLDNKRLSGLIKLTSILYYCTPIILSTIYLATKFG
jgi:hypothetical protein